VNECKVGLDKNIVSDPNRAIHPTENQIRRIQTSGRVSWVKKLDWGGWEWAGSVQT